MKDYKCNIFTTSLFIAAILAMGCTDDSSKGNKLGADQLVECNYSSNESIDQIKSIFKSASIVPLEQSEDSMVSSNCEILELDGGYLLIDKQQRSCVRFDQNGEYKNHIGHAGRAGDEYLNISSVQLDSGDVLIYSTTNSTIYRYSVDGDFLGSTDTGIKAQQLLSVGDKYYGYFGYNNGQQEERILVYDKTFTKIGQHLPSTAKLIVFAESVAPLTIYDGDIYIRETYNNCIHTLSSSGEILTPIGFDFKSYNIPSECFTQTDPFKSAEIMLSKDIASIYRFERCENYSIVQVNYQMVGEDIKLCNMIGIARANSEYKWITATTSGSNAILHSSIRHISESGVVTALVDRDVLENFNSQNIGFIDNFGRLQYDNDNPIIVRFTIK